MEGHTMKPVQWKAVDLLVSGATQKRAAAECGVCDFTIRRWLQRRDFQDAMEKELLKLRAVARQRNERMLAAAIARTLPHKTAHISFQVPKSDEKGPLPHKSAHFSTTQACCLEPQTDALQF
jgi:hypothetical protein